LKRKEKPLPKGETLIGYLIESEIRRTTAPQGSARKNASALTSEGKPPLGKGEEIDAAGKEKVGPLERNVSGPPYIELWRSKRKKEGGHSKRGVPSWNWGGRLRDMKKRGMVCGEEASGHGGRYIDGGAFSACTAPRKKRKKRRVAWLSKESTPKNEKRHRRQGEKRGLITGFS